MPPKNETVELPAPPPSPAPELKPFEQWAAEKGTADWQLAALKAFKNYPDGREVSAAEFDKALTEALKSPVG
jgi:hypothetical protein